MRVKATLLAGIAGCVLATPAFAQDNSGTDSQPAPRFNSGEIVVTAQRQSESLQEVPIAVSAFTAEALESQTEVTTSTGQRATLPKKAGFGAISSGGLY